MSLMVPPYQVPTGPVFPYRIDPILSFPTQQPAQQPAPTAAQAVQHPHFWLLALLAFFILKG